MGQDERSHPWASRRADLVFAHDRPRELRRERRVTGQPWTLDEVAGLIGVDASAISRWENGLRVPAPALLRALCEALDVGAYYFLPIPESGPFINHLRLRRFLMQKGVADQLGIAHQTFSAVELATRPLGNQRTRLASILGVSEEEIQKAYKRAKDRRRTDTLTPTPMP